MSKFHTLTFRAYIILTSGYRSRGRPRKQIF
jgi:hypothetical protein